MPRKPTAPYWKDRVKALYEGDGREKPPSAREIASILTAEGGSEAPAQRTIEKIIAKHKRLPEEERAPYRTFTWPQSMTHGLLPWEASACLLELIGLYFAGFGSPSIRFARWFWRVTQAAPDLDIQGGESMPGRRSVAGQLAIGDALGLDRAREGVEAARWYLAYAPWRNRESAERYHRAVEGGIPQFSGARIEMTESEADMFLRSCLYGVEVSPYWLARRHQ